LNTATPASLQSAVQQQSKGAVAPSITFSQSGRGSFTQGSTQSFTPPTEEKKTRKRKLKNGLIEITEIKEKKHKKEDNVYDEKGDLNWEVLEQDRKRKPALC
jgi:hypothetical protein